MWFWITFFCHDVDPFFFSLLYSPHAKSFWHMRGGTTINIAFDVTNSTLGNGWTTTKLGWHTTCRLIHKKCHKKSYHNDIKHHITLNTIFSVVHMNPVSQQGIQQIHRNIRSKNFANDCQDISTIIWNKWQFALTEVSKFKP